MHQAACQEVADSFTDGPVGVARSIQLLCASPACDRSGGAGTARITQWSGGVVLQPFTYAGDPNPLPTPACTGLDAEVCTLLWPLVVEQLPPSWHLQTVSLSCIAAVCNVYRGEARVEVTLQDGGADGFDQQWQNGLPEPQRLRPGESVPALKPLRTEGATPSPAGPP